MYGIVLDNDVSNFFELVDPFCHFLQHVSECHFVSIALTELPLLGLALFNLAFYFKQNVQGSISGDSLSLLLIVEIEIFAVFLRQQSKCFLPEILLPPTTNLST